MYCPQYICHVVNPGPLKAVMVMISMLSSEEQFC